MAVKTFTSTTLTASELNTYFMGQVWIKCTSGTRPTVAEGQAIYETDTDKVYCYDGTNFVEILRVGAWTSYTPTQAGVVGTTSTLTGKWMRMSGRTICFYANNTLGGTISVSAAFARVGLPVDAATTRSGIFSGMFEDAGSAFYPAMAINGSASAVDLWPMLASGTYLVYSPSLSSTVPFTWAATDGIYVNGMYEAAAST